MNPFKTRVKNYTGCGYLYILSNPSFKDNIMKIGFSKDAVRRSKELFTVGLPTRFSIEYVSRYSDNIRCIEHEIHKMYENERVSNNREFFFIKDLQTLIYHIESLLDSESNLEEYERGDVDKSKCSEIELKILNYFDRVCCVTLNPTHYVPALGFYESFLDHSDEDIYIPEWKFYRILRNFYKIKIRRIDKLESMIGVMYRLR